MIAFLLLAAGAVQPVPAELAAAVRGYDQAQIDGNRTQLEHWLAEDYLLVNSSGESETKAQLIADYTAPGFHLEPFTIEQPVGKFWGEGAVMGGIATLRGTDGGKRYEMRLRFADVWARRNGRWQVIYTQVAKAP